MGGRALFSIIDRMKEGA